MLDKLSTIRFLKLFIHSFLVMFIINILFLLSADLISWGLGNSIEKYNSNVPLIIFIVWLLFATQRDKYQKVSS